MVRLGEAQGPGDGGCRKGGRGGSPRVDRGAGSRGRSRSVSTLREVTSPGRLRVAMWLLEAWHSVGLSVHPQMLATITPTAPLLLVFLPPGALAPGSPSSELAQQPPLSALRGQAPGSTAPSDVHRPRRRAWSEAGSLGPGAGVQGPAGAGCRVRSAAPGDRPEPRSLVCKAGLASAPALRWLW